MIPVSIKAEPTMVNKDKLDRGVHAALVAPDADQEIHGNQHHFPKYEEKDQIE